MKRCGIGDLSLEELIERIPDHHKMSAAELTTAVGIEMAKAVFAEVIAGPTTNPQT